MEKFEPAARAICRMNAVANGLSAKQQEKFVEDNWSEMRNSLIERFGNLGNEQT
jgi:hypothetical protein